MKILGPVTRVERECERVLRTLPDWFGDEESLVEYADNTARLNTFVAEDNGRIVGFLSLQQHFRSSWEINCIAVEAGSRNAGVGRALQQRAEDWLKKQGAKTLQVKTLADSHPSPDYAETRLFYEAVGYIPIEVFPTLWHEGLPVLQFIKLL